MPIFIRWGVSAAHVDSTDRAIHSVKEMPRNAVCSERGSRSLGPIRPIDLGKIEIEFQSVDLQTVVDDTVAAVRPAIEGRG